LNFNFNISIHLGVSALDPVDPEAPPEDFLLKETNHR
jgi:hypothetical protein